MNLTHVTKVLQELSVTSCYNSRGETEGVRVGMQIFVLVINKLSEVTGTQRE